MLVQDMLTGRLHEVPDQSYGSNFAGYGNPYGDTWGEPQQQYGQVLYDGLGNPVGFLPGIASLLAPLATKAVGALAPLAAKAFSAAAPMISKALPMISQALPMISQALPMISQALPAPTQAMPLATQTFPPPWRFWRRRRAQPSYTMGYYGEETKPPVTAPMTAQQVTPPPMEPIPAPAPGPAPAPPMMSPLTPAPVPISPMPYGPMVVPYPSMRRRRRCRCLRMIRRPLAVPPPPRGPIRDATSAQSASTVQGWGYPGGFNGYGRW
jgi:hypothetical protein